MISLKLFLTSGVTLTVNGDEDIFIHDSEADVYELYEHVSQLMSEDFNEPVEFTVHLEDKEDNKYVHHYNVPVNRISWFMIEEVAE